MTHAQLHGTCHASGSDLLQGHSLQTPCPVAIYPGLLSDTEVARRVWQYLPDPMQTAKRFRACGNFDPNALQEMYEAATVFCWEASPHTSEAFFAVDVMPFALTSGPSSRSTVNNGNNLSNGTDQHRRIDVRRSVSLLHTPITIGA